MPRNGIYTAINHGIDILESLRARGIRIALRHDGTPTAGPRELLGEDELAQLRDYRDLVIAALGYELAAAENERGVQ